MMGSARRVLMVAFHFPPLAGSSGFAKQASWIGGGTLVSAFQLFSVERQLDIFSQDLAANADATPV